MLKVGDKVKNKDGRAGVIQEITGKIYFVNYGSYAEPEHLRNLKKYRLPTDKEVWESAKRENFELRLAQLEVKQFCRILAGIYD